MNLPRRSSAGRKPARKISYRNPAVSLYTWLFLLLAGSSWAEGPSLTNFSLELSARAWFSAGSGSWSITHEGEGAFTSSLEWEDLDSNMLVLDAECRLAPQLSVRAAYGSGRMNNAENTDTDYHGAGSDAALYWTSVSDSKGDTSFIDLSIALRLFPYKAPIPGKLNLDLILSYMHYRDEIIDSDAIETVRFGSPASTPIPGRNATYDFAWSAMCVGFKTEYEPTPNLTMTVSVAASHAWNKGEGFWNLREDLRPVSPNLKNDADGTGLNAAINVVYRLTSRLSANVGWQIISLEAENGTHTQNFVSGETAEASLDNTKSQRSGFLAGLTATF